MENVPEKAILITVRDAAQLLSISVRSLQRLVDGGKCPAPVRVGGRVLHDRQKIERWVADGCPALPSKRGR